jgi:serine/threonine protein kinase
MISPPSHPPSPFRSLSSSSHSFSSSIHDYDIGQQLGRGGFATVYHARLRHPPHPLSSSFEPFPEIALKVIDKSKTKNHDMAHRVQNELRIHSSLNHSSIVKLFHWFEDEKYYYLVLELCSYGTLFQYLKQQQPLEHSKIPPSHSSTLSPPHRLPLSEKQTAKFCYKILIALEYLQSQRVIHRDLKLSNLLFCDQHYETIKLCDFGLAVQLEHPDEEHFTICGTPNYIAPEIASNKSHSFPADIWSLGCLCYSMLTGGILPFATPTTMTTPAAAAAAGTVGREKKPNDVQETLKRIVAGEYVIPSHLEISSSALSFLGMILHVVRATSLPFLYLPL